LLLTGPAGGGKTTAIRVVAKELGIDLVEWGEGAEEWSLGGGIGKFFSIHVLTQADARPRIANRQALFFSSTACVSTPESLLARIVIVQPNSPPSPINDFFTEPYPLANP